MDLSLALSISALILAIPLAVIANIATPKVSDWIGRKNIKNAEKQLLDIEQQQEIIKNYRKDANSLIAFRIRSILKVLFLISLASMLYATAKFMYLSISGKLIL